MTFGNRSVKPIDTPQYEVWKGVEYGIIVSTLMSKILDVKQDWKQPKHAAQVLISIGCKIEGEDWWKPRHHFHSRKAQRTRLESMGQGIGSVDDIKCRTAGL